MTKKEYKAISIISMFFNVLFLCVWAISAQMNERYGVLQQDISVGIFEKEDVIFTLPAGMIVKDETHAFDLDYTFSIKVNSADKGLVDYSRKSINSYKSTYSADCCEEK